MPKVWRESVSYDIYTYWVYRLRICRHRGGMAYAVAAANSLVSVLVGYKNRHRRGGMSDAVLEARSGFLDGLNETLGLSGYCGIS